MKFVIMIVEVKFLSWWFEYDNWWLLDNLIMSNDIKNK
jgi:hypothetical protein